MKLYEGAGKTVELDESEMDELEEICKSYKHMKDTLSQIEDKNKKMKDYMEELEPIILNEIKDKANLVYALLFASKISGELLEIEVLLGDYTFLKEEQDDTN